MIDLHAHLLPGLDDGPDTLAESLDMARMAVDDGITTCVLTPHIHPGRFDNQRSRLEPELHAFRQALAQHQIPLNVRLGAEVRVSMESLDLLLQDELPFLGSVRGSRILLLELPHSHIPVGCMKLVERLLSMNVRPLLAHPERNKAVMDAPARIAPFLAAGCWLQLTASAITGGFGRVSQQVALHLLDEDAVRVVASDAHNLSARPPRLSPAHAFISQRWGVDRANELLRHHPAQILGLPG